MNWGKKKRIFFKAGVKEFALRAGVKGVIRYCVP